MDAKEKSLRLLELVAQRDLLDTTVDKLLAKLTDEDKERLKPELEEVLKAQNRIKTDRARVTAIVDAKMKEKEGKPIDLKDLGEFSL